MKKLICGPMATLSHEGFRRIVESFGGCDEYYTEMMNAPSLLNMGPFEKYYLMNYTAPEKIVWQLTGREGESMAKAASFLTGLGGLGIDINMGCSAPAIYKTGAGITWMTKSQEETFSMVDGVRKAIDVAFAQNPVQEKKPRLSVKLRLGDENFIDEGFFNFCRRLAGCGVERLVLHPRTKKEKLARPPRLHYVQDLSVIMKDFNVPVVLNGNVKCADSARNALAQCPDAEGIMISRACAQKPWIFAGLKKKFPECFGNLEKTVESADVMQVGLDFIEYLKVYQPPEFHLTRMQRFFAYYCDNLFFGHLIKSQMLNCKDLDSAAGIFAAYFERNPAERFKNI